MQNRPNYAIQFLSQAPGGTFPLSIHDHPHHPAREIDYLHRHDCLELGLCLEGEGVFVVEGKIMNFRRGDYSVIDPTEAHLSTSAAGTTSHWVWYYLDFERILLPHFPDLDLRFLPALRGAGFRNIRDGGTDPRGSRLLEELFRAEEQEEQCALVLLLALHFRKQFGETVPHLHPERNAGEFERVAPAIAYFSRNCAGTATVTAAARLCCMSLTNFRRVFRRELGSSPQEYLNKLRIGMALAELRSGRSSISEVAARCGFPSLSCFNRQFRKQQGCTPREFRLDSGKRKQ